MRVYRFLSISKIFVPTHHRLANFLNRIENFPRGEIRRIQSPRALCYFAARERKGETASLYAGPGHAIDVIEIFGLNIWRRISPGSEEMSASKTGIPCGWHQRKQARRRGTNAKEEARFYVEWIDPAARSTLTAAHYSACNRPPRAISRLHRDVATYAATANRTLPSRSASRKKGEKARSPAAKRRYAAGLNLCASGIRIGYD